MCVSIALHLELHVSCLVHKQKQSPVVMLRVPEEQLMIDAKLRV